MQELNGQTEELLSLQAAAAIFSRAGVPCSARSLYSRIHRGTLLAERVGRRWYIPRTEVKRLIRCAQRQSANPTRPAYFVIEFPDPAETERLARLTVAQRGRAALEAQAFLRGTIRARLRRMYPDLSPREITYKYFEEVAQNG